MILPLFCINKFLIKKEQCINVRFSIITVGYKCTGCWFLWRVTCNVTIYWTLLFISRVLAAWTEEKNSLFGAARCYIYWENYSAWVNKSFKNRTNTHSNKRPMQANINYNSRDELHTDHCALWPQEGSAATHLFQHQSERTPMFSRIYISRFSTLVEGHTVWKASQFRFYNISNCCVGRKKSFQSF